MRHRAVVIGGGLGGLAAALRLAVRGWAVTVCEQGATLGGKMNRWAGGGFTFDTGPSLITMPWIFEELFADAGRRIEDCVTLRSLAPIANYRYADGAEFDYTTDLAAWLDTVRRLDGRDVQGFLRYMALGARLFALSKDTFLGQPLFAPPKRHALAALRHLPLRYAWGNYHCTVTAHFHSPHLRQLYDRYPTYVGSSPYQTPAMLSLIPYIEYACGGWFIMGGLYRLVEALTHLLEERGVELQTNARVDRICAQGKQVRGVELASGEAIPADVVLMNGDAGAVAGMLEGAPGPTGLPAEQRSLSGIVFLLGLKRRAPGLHHHNVFFSADYHVEFGELFGQGLFPSDPTVYVNIPSRSDPSCAPDGGEAVYLMANAPADGAAWDDARTAEARKRIMARLAASGFSIAQSDIAVEQVITPEDMARRYAMPGGAIYGCHSHGWRNAFLRPPNKDRRMQGLYYVGGSVHPGGGTPVVLQSAKIAVDLISQCV